MNLKRLPQPRHNNLWFRYNESDAVLVFVHGVLSDSRSCWLYEDKKDPKRNCYWPELIESDRRFNDVSIYLGGYYTSLDSGSYLIRHCADELFGALGRQGPDGYAPVMEKRKITFVCHSTGGIVTRYLLEANHDKFQEKEVGLVLIASPSYGSTLANTLDRLIVLFNQQQGAELQWGNWGLVDLDDRFKELKEKRRIPSLSGIELYENHFILHYKWIPIFTKRLVVSKEAAGRYFGSPKQVPDTDHFSICKPRVKTDLVHEYLFDFLRDSKLLPDVALEQIHQKLAELEGHKLLTTEREEHAVEALRKAFTETQVHLGSLALGGAPNRDVESNLARLWSDAAGLFRAVDGDVALLLQRKSDTWARPELWKDPEHCRQAGITIEKMQELLVRFLAGRNPST